NVTKIVASTMPGTAKITLTSCAESHCPKSPCMPNSSTYINPATTGETEKGRSISVVRNDFPANSNFAIAQAAASPKTTFNGTVMAATISVSFMAERESGSTSACQYAET